jgi:hypothetical protein
MSKREPISISPIFVLGSSCEISQLVAYFLICEVKSKGKLAKRAHIIHAKGFNSGSMHTQTVRELEFVRPQGMDKGTNDCRH